MIALILFACLETPNYENPLAIDDDGDGYTEFGGDQNDADPNYVNDISCPDVHLSCPQPVVTCPSVTVDTVVCPELPEIPACPEPVECPDVNVDCPSVPTSTGTGASEIREYFTETWECTGNCGTWTNTDSRPFIITGILGGANNHVCFAKIQSPTSNRSIVLYSMAVNGAEPYSIPLLAGDAVELSTSGSSNGVFCMFTGYWVSYE